jgi:DNA-binding CsgD family transcriptional regulator
MVGTDVYYYATLGEAFAAAAGASPDEPDEITLLTDIVIAEPILIDTPKHIRLVAGNAADGGSSRTISRDGSNTANPLFRITGSNASLTLGKPGTEYELFIDGGYLNTPPVRSEAPLIAVNGPGAKLVMHGNVFLQNNYNTCAAQDSSVYQNGAGVFIRTLNNDQDNQAEFIMKGGTIRGNINNTQNTVPCGGGVFIAGFGIFTMEGGIIAGNTAYKTGGGFHTGSRGSFKKTGGVIYGIDAPEELQNKVVNGVGRTKIHGYAVCVPPPPNGDQIYRGQDTTVYENHNLTFTGTATGEGVSFGANEVWSPAIYIPESTGPGFIVIFAVTLASLCLLLALALIIHFQRRNKAAGLEKPDIEALGLSPREKEIFTLLLTDMAAKQIAHTLQISYSAVNFHSNNLYRKLGIQSRVELFSKFVKK